MEINANKSRPRSRNPRFYWGFRKCDAIFHTSELANLGVARRNRHLTRWSDARNASANAPTPAHAHTRTNARTNARAHARQRGRTRATRTHAHTRATRPSAPAHTPAHAGAPAPAYARDRELAALQRALQVRCNRVLSDADRSERYAGRGFA